ncbi:MAG: hypothetical protein RML74_08240 [Acidobacteriota bacterium]|nr:hypothetical protein [Acidobacteriota bacterium]
MGLFTTPGAASVYTTASGRFGFAVHRDANRVTVVYSGLRTEKHGDHDDLVVEAPYVMATVNTGPRPTHFTSHGKWSAIYNDGDGTVALFNEEQFEPFVRFSRFPTTGPDHGVAVVIGGVAVLGEVVLVGSLNLGRVDVYTLDGRLTRSFEGCPRLHGEAVHGDVVAFGCADGVLLIENRQGSLEARKLLNPSGTPSDVRVGTLVAHKDVPHFIGNFGQGLVFINPLSNTMTPVPLPARLLRFGVDLEGKALVALTADGKLHVLDPRTGVARSQLDAVSPWPGGANPRPGLALGEEVAYVSDPPTGDVVEVDLEGLRITRRISVGGAPTSLTMLPAPEGQVHGGMNTAGKNVSEAVF